MTVIIKSHTYHAVKDSRLSNNIVSCLVNKLKNDINLFPLNYIEGEKISEKPHFGFKSGVKGDLKEINLEIIHPLKYNLVRWHNCLSRGS